MNTYMGMRILISPDTITPKLQLSQDCPVTPEFRAEMNAWMREFFGVTVSNTLEDGRILPVVLPEARPSLSLFTPDVEQVKGEQVLYMNPRTRKALEEKIAAQAEAMGFLGRISPSFNPFGGINV